MKTWDISVGIREGMPVWPGERAVILERTMSLDRGDVANASWLGCGVHTGTHVDAPGHMVKGGGGVDDLDLDPFIGPAWVAEFPECREVTAADLERAHLPGEIRRLLLKTRNSERWGEPLHAFRADFTALTSDAARWVVERGIRLVGVDYLSVQLFADTSTLTHTTLLEANVAIVEGLDLRGVEAGEYELLCLPLKLIGCDGAPARAILRR